MLHKPHLACPRPLLRRSYYFLVSLSVLPDSAYPALAQLLGDPGALLSGGRPAPPAARWVLAHVTSLQLAGAALFLAGNALQCHSHWLLARLARRGRKGGYKIPRGVFVFVGGWVEAWVG